MNSAKVSVVIPIYKVENYLRECLDSVRNQTLRDIEVILIDDGSPDNCGIIADEYVRYDNRFSVIHKKNGGVSAARNDGLKMCRGDYIYIMDSDDYLEVNALELMYQKGFADKADIVLSDHFSFDEKGNVTENHLFTEDFFTDDLHFIRSINNMILYPTYSPRETSGTIGLGIAPPWTKLIKKELIINNSLRFDSEVKGIFDDGLFSMSVFQLAESVSYIHDCLYHYRLLSSSLIHNYNPNRHHINRIIFQKIESFGKRNSVMPDFWNAYSARIVMFTSIEIGTNISNQESNMEEPEQVKLLRETVGSVPYSIAFKNVQVRKLTNRYKFLVYLVRLRLYKLIIKIYKYRNMKKA